MVLLKIISNVIDTMQFDVDEEQSVQETRVLLQEILGYDSSLLTLTFRGRKLIDVEEWEDIQPKEGEKLFASVNTAALNNRNNNNSGSSQNAGGGANMLPGMATAAKVSKEQEERDAVKRAQSMEPMIEMMANNPATIDMMIASSPQIKQMLKDHPEMEKELRNPETLKMMMRAQFNPDAKKEMNRSMQMQMAQLNTIPGGMAMLENKLGGLLNESANYGPKTDADRQMASEENATPQQGQTSNNRPLPNPFARSNGSNGNQGGSGNNMPGGMNSMMGMGGAGMPGMGMPGVGGGGMTPQQMEQEQQLLQQLMMNSGGGGNNNAMGGNNPMAGLMGMGGGGSGMGFNNQPPPSASNTNANTTTTPPVLPTPPNTKSYEDQVKVLVDEMGFEDEALCLEALRACNGDIDDAVCYIAEKQDEAEAAEALRKDAE